MFTCIIIKAENIYNDEEPDTPATELEQCPSWTQSTGKEYYVLGLLKSAVCNLVMYGDIFFELSNLDATMVLMSWSSFELSMGLGRHRIQEWLMTHCTHGPIGYCSLILSFVDLWINCLQ